jgi:hypothetical protein
MPKPAHDYRETPGVEGLRGINRTQRLYVMPCGDGFSCYGFDVLHRKTQGLARWLCRADLAPPARRGTVKAWKAWQAALEAAHAHHKATGARCDMELTPALTGLEGHRVEVTAPGQEPRRFWVGKSTGWTPCHLEIARRDSHGGGAVYLPEGASVRVLYDAGYL